MPSALSGSSPLTRGKRLCELLVPVNTGLIPAHAGKTLREALATVSDAAHPRSRGENPKKEIEELRRVGSSPLTRGKPWLMPSW